MVDQFHKFVFDEIEVIKFFEKLFLPQLDVNANKQLAGILLPIARKKYLVSPVSTTVEKDNKEIKEVKEIKKIKKLPRIVFTAKNGKEFVKYFYQMECNQKAFYHDDSEEVISTDLIVIYATVNLKCVATALNKTSTYMTQSLIDSSSSNKIKSFYSKFKSDLHKSTACKRYVDIDFDVKIDDIPRLKFVFDFFTEGDYWKDIYLTVKTRGGFHIIFDSRSLPDMRRKNLHHFFNQLRYLHFHIRLENGTTLVFY